MDRRSFSKGVFSSLAAVPFISWNKRRKTIKARRLQAGDTIGLITPGSYISDEGLQKAVDNLGRLGFRIKMGKHIRAKRGYNAGTDQQRLDDLHAMFADQEVAGIWCARGGYGCSRLLPHIDYELIRNNPKALIGYSDITALLMAIYHKTGLVGFHGPVASSTFTPYTEMHFKAVLVEALSNHSISLSSTLPASDDPAFEQFVLKNGKAEGPLMGGNLSLLAALAGTEFLPSPKGHLIFLEEIGEKPYRVDRMLTQLQQAWPLREASGLALGIFNDCQPKPDELSLSLKETIQDQAGRLSFPAAYGFTFGHIDEQCTLPFGINARMDTSAMTLTLLEAAVE
ncbi:MAG TPA: LD-carboxypeptidase [Saprospiraceae bacterium]|nr:LD-carboxypeptidase [Saprospiraceae bacterium]HMQ84831.1 LD-carboxypeptidase [Saprospiraceae bacterium]